VFCWTGTGASIAANKVAGIRAALCSDAETARGAKKWNHANVLAISLRSTSEAIAKEILDAWFETPCADDEWNVTQIARIRELDEKHWRRARIEQVLAWLVSYFVGEGGMVLCDFLEESTGEFSRLSEGAPWFLSRPHVLALKS
jgi:hypothetical protein